MIKERLLDLLKKHPLSEKLIYEFFSDSDEVKNELQNLISEGEIVKIKKEFYLPSQFHLIRGKIVSIKENYSFASISEEEDVYINNENLDTAFIDDEVYLEKISERKDHEEYAVVSIIKRGRNKVTGEVKVRGGHFILKTENIASNDVTFIIDDKSLGLTDGMIVLANISKITSHTVYLNEVEIIGHKNDPGVDISRIIIKYGADIEFNDEVKKEVKKIPDHVLEEEKVGREDFRDNLIVTIDGDDAKDFDDAVEVIRINDGYRVGVHIADVAHYVKEGSSLDKEALSRGTSIYVTDRVVPMIPFSLSNGICSLNPGVERLVTSCIFDVDQNGFITSSRITKGIIKSKARLTYNYVNNVLNHVPQEKKFNEEIDSLIYLLNEVATKLRKRKKASGALDIDTTEISFKCDEKGWPYEVNKKVSGSGEKLIESLMIAANEQVAETIEAMKLPFIYRIHEHPKSKKMEMLIKMSLHLGKKLDINPLDVSSKELASYISSLEDENLKNIMSIMMLRSLAKARYSPKNVGHFGLASTSYTHFTSPIRRYPDLEVHRLIDRYLVKGNVNFDNGFLNEIEYIAENSSVKERRAQVIEREVDDLSASKYMSSHLGDEYEGFINGMSAKGMFVELDSGINGFVPYESLVDDYYYFDEEYMEAYGKRSNHTFLLGDKVKVSVVSADINEHTITFNLLTSIKSSKIKVRNKRGKKVKYGRKHQSHHK